MTPLPPDRRLAVGSLEYRYFRITVGLPDEDGQDVPDLGEQPVAIGFARPTAKPTELHEAAWVGEQTVLPDGRKSRRARVFIGPGGGFELPRGRYDTWAKVTDSPEIPLIPAGPFEVY